MKKKKVRVCQNLGTVAKAQRLLWKCEQDRSRFKRLYVSEAMEHGKAVRRFETEIEHTAYYCDCVKFLHLALIEAKSLNKEGIEGKIKEYREFKNVAYENFIKKKETLNKVESSVFGKYIVVDANNEETLKRDLKEARTMLEKEKAFSCYLYDCREALLTRLYDVGSKSPQVDKALEHYRKFDLMASKRLEEKVKSIIG
ncbi:hypothetical protein [Bacteroides pyogenes]|uniref:hypothetical protein n=1 Tax=Bacteroides pyogenes TaxID=310300 RepID=UPI00242DE2A9|nr:hypothetical protein [Bacteroides pyogenes]MCI7070124.1 hypothetical protein [Bacteroides pyogenes]